MKTYRISKYEPKEDKWYSYGGGYTEEDVKAITKGYKSNGLFYERKGTRTMYEVVEE